MTEIVITKARRAILETCNASHGAPEHKWSHDPLDRKIITFLIDQKLVERFIGDGRTSFVSRLRLTDRGRAALRGDMLTKL